MTVETVAVIVAAIAGTGGLAALFRLRGENSRIVVDAAQGAVIVQSGVITALRDQVVALERRLDEADKGHERARALQEKLDHSRGELTVVTRQRDTLLDANDDLRQRVEHLENEVAVLRVNAGLPPSDS